MRKQSGKDTRLHTRLSSFFFWAWLQPQFPDFTTTRSFDSQSKSWVCDVLGLFFKHFIHGCLYHQALADVGSTGVGTKCLFY